MGKQVIAFGFNKNLERDIFGFSGTPQDCQEVGFRCSSIREVVNLEESFIADKENIREFLLQAWQQALEKVDEVLFFRSAKEILV